MSRLYIFARMVHSVSHLRNTQDPDRVFASRANFILTLACLLDRMKPFPTDPHLPESSYEAIFMKLAHSAVVVCLFVSISLSGLGQSTQHAFLWTSQYGMKDLGSLGASSYAQSINVYGQVAGYFVTQVGDLHAFRWTPKGGMKDLGTLGGNFSVAWAIADSGVVVGSSSNSAGAAHAVAWTPAGTIVDLGTLGGTSSEALGVNDKAGVVGDSSLTGDTAYHAFLLSRAGHMQDLKTLGGTSSSANSVNAYRVVVGNSATSTGDEHAFLWTSALGMQDLGSLGGTSNAIGINDLNHVVGFSVLTGSSPFHAFWWTKTAGLQDLGTLGDFSANSDSFAVNNSDQIVGYSFTDSTNSVYHAVIWQGINHTISDLGTLGGSNSMARAINAAGQVVGSSDIN